MTNGHHLNDYTHADRALERLGRLPAVDAWEREKQAARRSWLREFGKALAYAAAVAVALKMMGAV